MSEFELTPRLLPNHPVEIMHKLYAELSTWDVIQPTQVLVKLVIDQSIKSPKVMLEIFILDMICYFEIAPMDWVDTKLIDVIMADVKEKVHLKIDST